MPVVGVSLLQDKASLLHNFDPNGGCLHNSTSVYMLAGSPDDFVYIVLALSSVYRLDIPIAWL